MDLSHPNTTTTDHSNSTSKYRPFIAIAIVFGSVGSVILISTDKSINEATLVASLSICFYGSLCLISTFFYATYTLRKFEKRGLYDDSKRFFLGVLALSSVADLPLYIVCIVKGGPYQCEWKDISYYITWFLQLLSLSGFCLILVIPSVLWADVMKGYGTTDYRL